MIRTRFAPSPTGKLHFGVTRTALFSWLFARHYGGEFILRIEDTDQARSTLEFTQSILDSLKWLGLDYDEGPYFQSKRFERYQAVLKKLLETGHAYHCYCSLERLEALKNEQLLKGQKPRYDRYCRDRVQKASMSIQQTSSVIRFKTPIEGMITIDDQLLGNITFNQSELDDFVLARADHAPTYNFTVVVDDHDMNITHVIRGNDHVNNTPRQINVLKALNASIPTYIHLPMIHAENGKKLSKRENATDVMHYQALGYLPDALINYLARLGWSHGNQEIFTREELIHYFDGQHLSKSAALLNEDKLLWLNQQHLKQANVTKLAKLFKPFVVQQFQNAQLDADLAEIVSIQRKRAKTLKDMAENSQFLYHDPVVPEEILSSELKAIITVLYSQITKIAHWDIQAIDMILHRILKCYQLKPKQLFQPLRMILTGAKTSPPINETLYLLGQSRVLTRLKHAIESDSIN